MYRNNLMLEYSIVRREKQRTLLLQNTTERRERLNKMLWYHNKKIIKKGTKGKKGLNNLHFDCRRFVNEIRLYKLEKALGKIK